MTRLRTPFASLRTDKGPSEIRGASPIGFWTGRIARVRRDDNRLLFLFDVVPLGGWPSPTETLAQGEEGAGTVCIPNVRMLQPFVGNLSDTTQSPTGLIVVPEVGSVVCVAPDDTGWVIIGFYSGPVVPAAGQFTGATERFYRFNPGFEEAESTLVNTTDVGIPWLLGIEEGDVVLGKGNGRVKLRREGIIVGAGPECMHAFKSVGGEFLERYAQMERRATGRFSYHRFFVGGAVTDEARRLAERSSIDLPANDAWIINTDIIEASPHSSMKQPYVIRQRGHLSKSVIAVGRRTGEIRPSPQEVSSEVATGKYSVMRETVVVPNAAPTNTAADVEELRQLSHVTHDFQVRPDGSFHFRCGNSGKTPQEQHVGESTVMNLDISYDATTNRYKINLQRNGAPVILIELDGLKGAARLEAENELTIKTKKLVLEGTSSIDVKTTGPLKVSANELSATATSGIKLKTSGTLSAEMANAEVKAAQIDVSGILSAQNFIAGVVGLLQHTHIYTDDGSPSSTQPPSA